MSETYPRKNHCETLFAGHTPSSAGSRCKGTTKNANAQILRVKKFVSFGMKSKRNIISPS